MREMDMPKKRKAFFKIVIGECENCGSKKIAPERVRIYEGGAVEFLTKSSKDPSKETIEIYYHCKDCGEENVLRADLDTIMESVENYKRTEEVEMYPHKTPLKKKMQLKMIPHSIP